MTEYFYEKTGMYVDWEQLERLPAIDTLIDVGVGAKGTEDLYERFSDKKMVLIDPLDEAEAYFNDRMLHKERISSKLHMERKHLSLK